MHKNAKISTQLVSGYRSTWQHVSLWHEATWTKWQSRKVLTTADQHLHETRAAATNNTAQQHSAAMCC